MENERTQKYDLFVCLNEKQREIITFFHFFTQKHILSTKVREM